MTLKVFENSIKKDWIILLVSAVLNYLGLFVVPLYQHGTIYAEEYFGTSIILTFFPISIPVSFLVIFIIYKLFIYFTKLPTISNLNSKYLILFWLVSFGLGVAGWYFALLPLLIFSRVTELLDLLILKIRHVFHT
jgi:uncharacterized membrane protein